MSDAVVFFREYHGVIITGFAAHFLFSVPDGRAATTTKHGGVVRGFFYSSKYSERVAPMTQLFQDLRSATTVIVIAASFGQHWVLIL